MLFTKHTPWEILGLNFEKKTVYLNYNFPIQWSAIITPERIQWRRYSTSRVWTQLINYAKHEFENLKAQTSRAAY